MGKGGKGGDGGASQARADEQARQQRIREGTQRINRVFDGYTDRKATGALSDFGALQNGGTYYDAAGNKYTYDAGQAPFMGAKPTGYQYTADGRIVPSYQNTALANSKAGPGSATAYKMAGEPGSASALQRMFGTNFISNPGEIYSGVSETSHGGFDDTYFDGRKQAYLDYAAPQLNDQYAQAQEQLAYSLDRSGMLDSSVRAKKQGELQKQYDINRQQVADKALEYSTSARNNVEDARANLISMLNATGDAEGAVNSAMTRAKALSQPDSYSPLSQMFSTFTSALGSQYAAEQARALAASTTPASSNPYWQSGKASGSVKVT